MSAYTNYTIKLGLKENPEETSLLSLLTEENVSEEKFVSIVNEVFNAYKDEVICYSIYRLLNDGYISFKTYEHVQQNSNSISEWGADRFPNKYKVINARVLSVVIRMEYPKFFERVPLKNVVINKTLL